MDAYALRAKKEHWRARSVYKLMEIDRRLHLIRKGDRVLDLGCHPGSWSQYLLSRTHPGGEVIGLDRTPTVFDGGAGFRFIQADISLVEVLVLAEAVGECHGVLSDLAPSTTGSAVTDTSRSLALASRAFSIALAVLKPGGYFVCKVFEGEDFRGFRLEAGAHFQEARTVRPDAVRKGSREVYFVGLRRIPSAKGREAGGGTGEP